MADDRLKNYVLARADADANLSEQARLVVLAALGAPEDLAEVLGDAATSTELVESLTLSMEVAGRYELQREIGSGGQGRVSASRGAGAGAKSPALLPQIDIAIASAATSRAA